MTPIIEELFFGNITPNLASFIDDKRYQQDLSTVDRTEALLTELLSGKEKQLFLQMVNAIASTTGTESVSHFSNGFRLGARMMLEVMTGEEHYLRY